MNFEDGEIMNQRSEVGFQGRKAGLNQEGGISFGVEARVEECGRRGSPQRFQGVPLVGAQSWGVRSNSA